jgi:hypothetical protein
MASGWLALKTSLRPSIKLLVLHLDLRPPK